VPFVTDSTVGATRP